MKSENGYLKNYLTEIISALSLEPDFAGVTVLTSYPLERLVFKEEKPVLTLGYEKLEFSSAGLCDFLGGGKDADGNLTESYGKRCNISLAFNLYMPIKSGNDKCFSLASNLCDFLSFNGVVAPLNITCSGVSFNQKSQCYQVTVTATVPTLVVYEQKAEQISNIIIRSVK